MGFSAAVFAADVSPIQRSPDASAQGAEDGLGDAFADEWLESYYDGAASASTETAAPAPPSHDAAVSGTDANQGAASSAPSSTPSSTEPLLPERLGPIETVLWGHHGLMRGIGFPLTEESRERELSVRRTMLTLHQVGGFLTLGVMTATVITGQMILNGRSDEDIYDRKKILAKTTIASYFTTAALALLSPPPMIKRKQFSSITVHKALGAVHFTGMVIMPILGQMLVDGKDYDATLRYHQTIGYITLAALAGAMIVVTF